MQPYRYKVLTWDMDAQNFTPQDGVHPGPWTLWELRVVLRLLRSVGYEANRSDASVLVERIRDPYPAPSP